MADLVSVPESPPWQLAGRIGVARTRPRLRAPSADHHRHPHLLRRAFLGAAKCLWGGLGRGLRLSRFAWVMAGCSKPKISGSAGSASA